MLERRQFLGTVATATTLTLAGPVLRPALADGGDLNWRCEVVQTVGQAPRHRAPVVTGVSIDPAGRLIAVVGDDHFVSVYSIDDRRFICFLSEHVDWVRTAQFHPVGDRLFTAGNDRRILEWNSRTWTRPVELARHPAAVINLAISPDGRRLVAVGFEQTARIYDLAGGSFERALECHCDDNHAVACSADSRLAAVGGRSGIVRVWDMDSGALLAESHPHRQRIRAIRFLDDGSLLSCSDDQQLRLTRLDRPDRPEVLPREPARQFDALLLDGETAVTGRSDNRIALWNVARRELMGTLVGHTGTVSCLAANDQYLVSGSYDTQVRIWHRQVHAVAPLQAVADNSRRAA